MSPRRRGPFDLRVGDPVVVVDKYLIEPVEGHVVWVGTRWVNVRGPMAGRPDHLVTYAVDRHTGAGKPERGWVEASFRGYTPEAWAAEPRRIELLGRARRLWSHGRAVEDLSADQLARIVAVLEENGS